MKYLLTAKRGGERKQIILHDDKEALNMLRLAILVLQPMEETSADLMAISLLERVPRSPQALENSESQVIIQQYNESRDIG